MSVEHTSPGVKDWLRDVSKEVKEVKEVAIRSEAKLEAYSQRTGETEASIKAHEMRLNDNEAKIANITGGMRMLQWIGGVIGGLVLIGQLAVMIIKG